MIRTVERAKLDVRYEGYRLQNSRKEETLLVQLSLHGIQEPLEGIDIDGISILLNGFKRYRCAGKLGLEMVPYISLSSDVVEGILKILQIANTKQLDIIEQARLIDDLQKSHGMSIRAIAEKLGRSAAWVSLRRGLIKQMSSFIQTQIFAGNFPVYSYMYTLRKFMRLNKPAQKEVDDFVRLISKHKLSTRDIEKLAEGWFNGTGEFRKQLKEGDFAWCLEALKENPESERSCKKNEYGLLKDLEIMNRYLYRVTGNWNQTAYSNPVFSAQANLLVESLLRGLPLFQAMMEELYDRTRKEERDLPDASGRNEPTKNLS